MTFAARCPWYVAGPLVGVVVIALRALLNKPFGALGGFINVFEHLAHPREWGVPAFITIGTVLGGLIFALVSHSFVPSFHYSSGVASLPAPANIAMLIGAGTVMGFGARLAGGCTSGHGICGMSLGSPASVVSTLTFFTTAVALAHLFAWLVGGA